MTPVSVVIATLGGPSLSATIDQLNAGTIQPAEILICIPAEYAHRVTGLAAGNVGILKTPCRGQVAQRACGFAVAASPFVLQLDDDIAVRSDCLEQLVRFLERHPGASVAPKFHDAATGAYNAFHVPTGTPSLFKRLFFRVMNGPEGYQPGQIGLSGVNMGLPSEPADWFDLGWLPGGCVLHRRDNLILRDYYPFSGKAFAEDLFHSLLLRRGGVRLMRCGAAICDVDFTSASEGYFIRTARDYLDYRRKMDAFVKLAEASRARFHGYLVLNALRLLGETARKRLSG